MRTSSDIVAHLTFMEDSPPGVVAYLINGAALGDSWKEIMVVFNGTATSQQLVLPGKRNWKTHVSDNTISGGKLRSSSLTIKAFSASILFRK
jgi:pullulanase